MNIKAKFRKIYLYRLGKVTNVKLLDCQTIVVFFYWKIFWRYSSEDNMTIVAALPHQVEGDTDDSLILRKINFIFDLGI